MVNFVRDLRPFYVRQVSDLLDHCTHERNQILEKATERKEEAEGIEDTLKRREEAEAEAELERLYPYHKQLREDKERRLAARLARQAASDPNRLKNRPVAGSEPSRRGLELPEKEDAYGLPYEKLRGFVLSASRKLDGHRSVAAVDSSDETKVSVSELRRLAAEARTRELRDMRELRSKWREERKNQDFCEEE